MSKMKDFQMECAEELVKDYQEELPLGEALKVVSTFGDFDFWRNYLRLKKFISEGEIK